MILQGVNIISGILLAAPKLKEWGMGPVLVHVEPTLTRYRNGIGVASLVLGALGLIERVGVVDLPIPMFGASYPQALPAVALGLLLADKLRIKYPALASAALPLAPHALWIGLLGVTVGLGSLLLGCFIPQFCGM